MVDYFTIIESTRRRWEVFGLLATILIILSVPLYILKAKYIADTAGRTNPSETATFVGREKCKECHKREYDKWANSNHDKAMDIASENTVLGDFNGAVLEHGGISTRFFRKDNRFFVHTQGPEGEMEDFEVTHTFGVYPLQQYLVPFPGGRLQCLTIAWDVEKKQWYPLPTHTNDSKDWLHWTKSAQNWNGMCAACHSTNLKKGYNQNTDTFTTTWSEIDVSCETCHGPCSHHVQWADKPEMARTQAENFKLVIKTKDMEPKEQLELCARCHARRSVMGDYGHKKNDLMDHMIPQLLDEGIYYADGQILDEVYVYGSFIQSKMYQRGISCNDCHDVHSLAHVKEGNDLCLQCHQANIYDTKDHHFHKKIQEGKPSKGDDCVSCHMPGRDYMGIDNRADHSIRIPRPDLSLNYEIPNSCNMSKCHDDKSNQWSLDYITKWYGIKKKFHYGTAIAAGRDGKPEAQADLIQLAKNQLFPPIVRATALSLLRRYSNPSTFKAVEDALSDGEALVRQTAISMLNQLNFEKKIQLIAPLLYDPVKGVRIYAALNLSEAPLDRLSADQKKVYQKALREYREAMEYSADFPSGRYNLGLMYANLGKHDLAVENYKAAIKIDDQFYPAKNNLAMLYNRMGKNTKAESLLREVISLQPELYETVYSLGLLLVEMKRPEEALKPLENAAKGLPQHPRISYNLGLLLQQFKRFSEAETYLLKASNADPNNFDFLFALADHYLKRERLQEAAQIAQQMMAKYPSNPIGKNILDVIHRKTNTTGK